MERLEGTWLVAVSAGPDSMALLSMCIENGTACEAAHVNYHHRDQADEEEAFIRRFCAENGIPQDTDVREYAIRGPILRQQAYLRAHPELREAATAISEIGIPPLTPERLDRHPLTDKDGNKIDYSYFRERKSRNLKTSVDPEAAALFKGQMILPGTIALFQKSYPNISVELTEASNGELHKKLLKGTIDLAIADFPENLPGISMTDFYREENVLVIEKGLFAKHCKTDPQECGRMIRNGDYSALRECPFVLGGIEDIDGRIGRNVLKRAGIDDPAAAAASHNVGMLLRLSLCGIGACICPQKIVQSVLTPQQADSMYIFPLGENAAYLIQFGYRAQSYQWSVIERFISCAKTVVC